MCGDEVGLGTGVMGMGWEWGETCGDGVGMGRTSCPHAALYDTRLILRTSALISVTYSSVQGGLRPRPVPSSLYHQRPVYQLRLI